MTSYFLFAAELGETKIGISGKGLKKLLQRNLLKYYKYKHTASITKGSLESTAWPCLELYRNVNLKDPPYAVTLSPRKREGKDQYINSEVCGIL